MIFNIYHNFKIKKFQGNDVRICQGLEQVPDMLRGCVLTIGNFVEIEGTKEKISETAEKLGLDMQDAVPLSYGELFMEHCKAKGIPLHDMVFKEGEK